MDKKTLRDQMKALRNALTVEQRLLYTDAIVSQVIRSNLYQEFDAICVYQAFRNEVDCEPIMQDAFSKHKKVFVPVTDLTNRQLLFYQVMPDTTWKKGAYQIMEPVIEKPVLLQEKALIFMPGLVFDKQKHRIGYGGGYYDKYLSIHPEHTTVALCYPFQIVNETIPFEPYDILPDYIYTGDSVY